MKFYKIQRARMATDEMPYDEAVTLDGAYIGSVEWAKMLCDERGIKPEIKRDGATVCSVGFCEKDQKWYGWSHRAIYGFGVGSEVKKGDCAYVASTPEGLIDSHANFFSDFGVEAVAERRAECAILPDRSGIRILHSPMVLPMASDLSEIEDAINGDVVLPMVDGAKDHWSIVKCGRGEWTAKTLDDARDMAVAFADGVS